MRNFLIRSALALAIGVTGLPLLAPQAMAQDLEIQIGPDGTRMRTRERCDPRFEDCRDDRYDRRDDRRDRRDRRDRDRYERRAERGCTEGQALMKAERMGIRSARIVQAGRRTIQVGGRSRNNGNRVSVTFARERGCPVFN